MSGDNYWTRLNRQQLSRRTLLRSSAKAGVGAAGLALVGCGDDDDDDGSTAAVDQQADDQADEATQDDTDDGEDEVVAEAPDGPQRGGDLKMHWGVEDSHLDPHISREHFSALLWRTVGNGILKQQAITNAPEADMADGWETPDELTFVFNLRENIKWHDLPPVDGRAFTADDAVFSFERMSDTSDEAAGLYPRASSFGSVEAFEAVDDRTLRIRTFEPTAPLLSAVSNKWSVMVAPEVVEQFEDLRSGDSAIGTGPFIAESASNVRGVRVVPNPNYFLEGVPYLDSIEWAVITDVTAQESAYIAGQTNGYQPPAADVDRFASRDDTNMIFYPDNNFHISAMGGPTIVAPLNDVRVRQAINLAIDRADIGRAAFPGAELGVAGVFADTRWGLTSEDVAKLPGYGADKAAERAEARALLDSAGYGDGFTLVVNTTEAYEAYHINRAVALQPQLAEIGITADLNVIEFGALKELETARDFEFTVATYAYFDDPDFPLFNSFHTEGSRNYWSWDNPDYNALVEKQRATLDEAERLELVREAQAVLLDQVPIALDTWFTENQWAIKKPLQNFQAGQATVQWEPATWWIDQNV